MSHEFSGEATPYYLFVQITWIRGPSIARNGASVIEEIKFVSS